FDRKKPDVSFQVIARRNEATMIAGRECRSNYPKWGVLTYGLALAVVWGSSCTEPHIQPTTIASRPASGPATFTLGEIEPQPRLPASAPAADETPAAAVRHVQTARERFEAELWSEAIAACQKALQIAPKFKEAHILAARAALQQGNSALARKHLDAA